MSEIYFEGSRVLKEVLSRRKSLKTGCYSLKRNAKTVYALLSKVISHRKDLEKSIQAYWPECLNKVLALLMVCDYWNIGKISGGGLFKKQIISKFPKNPPFLLNQNNKTNCKWLRMNQFKPAPSIELPNQDPLIPNLYHIKDTQYIKNYIKSYNFISQEKASCMPVSGLSLYKGN